MKWQSTSLQTRATLTDRVIREDSRKMDLSIEDVVTGLRAVKKLKRLDRQGLSVAALKFLFIAKPVELTEWFSLLLSARRAWHK